MTLRDLVTVAVTERVREGETVTDLVESTDAGTVKRGLGDTVTERVLVACCDGCTVVRPLGDRVKLRDLDSVTDTVADLVAWSEAGTVKRGLGDTVTERVLVACCDGCTVVRPQIGRAHV